MRKYENIPEARKAAILAHNQRMAGAVKQAEAMAAIGTRTERSQSDKLGSDIVRYYVGEVLVRSEYVQQEQPRGTQENPIPYGLDVPLIPNAFYALDGALKVWVSGADTGAAWDDSRWAAWDR